MWYPNRESDTICALASAAGKGSIAVVRISGKDAWLICRKLCGALPYKPESHHVYFGLSKDINSGNIVDETVFTFFGAGRSYTGEDVVEISCHGNTLIIREILRQLVIGGAKVAERGEFTFRAFMNGRMDLVQAESVMSLVESESSRALQISLRQLRGILSNKFQKILSDVLNLIAHVEASIDFSHEDIEIISRDKLSADIKECIVECEGLKDTYNGGKVIRDGLEVVLMGVPNVGKSSLLNKIVGEERAIVTNIPGTTRDLIEGSKEIEGVKVCFIDCAGLRASQEIVENIGIERAKMRANSADIVFFVFDATVGLTDFERQEIECFEGQQIVLLANKVDMCENYSGARQYEINDIGVNVLFTSSISDHGTNEVERYLRYWICERVANESAVVALARHFDELVAISNNLNRALAGVVDGISYEFVVADLYAAVLGVKRILGQEYDDDVLDRVFSKFCLGK